MENSTSRGTGSRQREEESGFETSLKPISSCDDEKLECMICGMRSNNLVSHVTRIHKLTSKEYYEKFPGSLLLRLTKQQIEKMRETKNKKETKNKIAKQKKRERESEVLDKQKLKCRICQFESFYSLIAHITLKHKLKMDEYRSMYPDCVVQRQPPSQTKRISEMMKEKLTEENHKENFLEWRSFPTEIKHWTRKGFSESEALQKVAEFQSAQSKKGNNEKTRTFRSQKYSGDNNPMSLKSISLRRGINICEARFLTPCHGRLGSLHPMFGKKHSEEAVKKIAGAHHLSNPTYRSLGEMELEKECRKISDEIRCNIRISKWNIDILFVSRNIVVEFFGDYWHMNPLKYNDDDVHPLYKKTAGEVRARDNRKIEGLKKLGYQVIVIWERDWHYDRENQIQRIKDAFNSV
jgi:G:T-mismatch repair DNA endonuclease (very short patch repair protein)